MTRSAIEFKARTKKLAIRVIRLVHSLPAKRSADVLGKQLLRSATSVGANYRAACRARSDAEFCAKLGIVEEEVDEVSYWLEMMIEAGLVRANLVQDLLRESNEISAMIVASIKTAKRRLTNAKQPSRANGKFLASDFGHAAAIQSNRSTPAILQSEIRNPKSEIS